MTIRPTLAQHYGTSRPRQGIDAGWRVQVERTGASVRDFRLNRNVIPRRPQAAASRQSAPHARPSP
ncbi:MAG TPA: hypothetical protein VNO52_17000 [Methylomirabilota bacterium]|nr:hypothetical protein [Methylomirabilota bacterium]